MSASGSSRSKYRRTAKESAPLMLDGSSENVSARRSGVRLGKRRGSARREVQLELRNIAQSDLFD